MVKVKDVRTKGKLQLSRYFQNFEEGDSVAVVKELSVDSNFPDRLQGRTGKFVTMRGQSCVVEIKDIKKDKKFLIAPIHLRKIK